MATPEKYDCIAIGSGEAGKLVPWILSGQHGKKCAIIERQWIGGSCPNIACLPSKNILHSASIAHETRMTHKHGIDLKDAQKPEVQHGRGEEPQGRDGENAEWISRPLRAV
jgi:pyruvate/2-oxoglutarate dehydrogenase complex dihydrolipoamide dehydrogenase (E3) component